MPERTIYLDHAATAALDPRVLDVMIPYFTTEYGKAYSPDSAKKCLGDFGSFIQIDHTTI